MLRRLAAPLGERQNVYLKEALVAAAWPQVAVTDELLARCISDVRAAIADHEHKIIKTVPRRGYLFTATSPAMSTPSLESSRAARRP